jgi:hypothetical protein
MLQTMEDNADAVHAVLSLRIRKAILWAFMGGYVALAYAECTLTPSKGVY